MGNVLNGKFKIRLKSGEVIEREVHTYEGCGYSFVLYDGGRVRVERCFNTWYEVPWGCDYIFDRYFKADDMEEYRFLIECFTEKGYEVNEYRQDRIEGDSQSGRKIVTKFSSDRETVIIEIPFEKYKGKYRNYSGKWDKR